MSNHGVRHRWPALRLARSVTVTRFCNPTRGQGDRLRADLVAAASRLLEEGDGEQTLSLRAVARQAGVVPQSVYLHFADRKALLIAVYEARFGELLDALGETTGRDARDRLRAICLAYCGYAGQHP